MMGKKDKNGGRGSQMIDRTKKKSEREERDPRSEPSTSGTSGTFGTPGTSGSSHERPYSGSSREKSYHSGGHEKSYYSGSHEKSYHSGSHEKSYHSGSYEKQHYRSHEKVYPSTSHEKLQPSTSHEQPQPSTSHEKVYPSTSREKLHHSSSQEKLYHGSSYDKPPLFRKEHEGERMAKKMRVREESSHEGEDEPPGPSEPPAVGRGQFLTQLARQPKLKPEPGASGEPSPFAPGRGQPSTSTSEGGHTERGRPPVVRMGETGERIKMLCNYITLTTTPGKGIFEYEVKFDPPVENVKNRHSLVYKYIPATKGIQCYDGMAKLFLPDAEQKKIVANSDEKEDGMGVTITAIFKRQVRLNECHNFYNILFNNCSKILKLTRLGRHHYDAAAHVFIPQHKLEVWPGYVTSVEEFEGGIHLCCDIKHRVLRTDTVYDYLADLIRLDPRNFKSKATKELLGLCVMTRYNNHMYRIDDIAWNESPMSTFSTRGAQITYVDYYKAQYNIVIKDLRQPLLIHIPKKKCGIARVCLIPELSYMTGLTDSMRKDMKVMKEVSMYTRITPAQREYGLKKFIDNINNSPPAQELLDNWGLKICREPVQLSGRVLPPEEIMFKNEAVDSSENAEWMRVLRREGVLRSVDIVDWVMLYAGREKKLADAFLRAIKEVGPNLGIKINDPHKVVLRDDRIETYIKGLKDCVKPKTQIVLCLCGSSREDRYSAIKKLCCLEMPVPSQVVNCGTISRDHKLRAVAQNVALQMNNKLGGASWAVHVPLKNCMICGIDTYHDTVKQGNSVGALVASMDSKYTNWFSQTCVQEPKQELLHGLVVCFAAALQKYSTINKKLPDRIVIFRDGVSDGQLKMVEEVEIKQFLDACKLAANYRPKFSYVIVQKRINTKLFLDKRGELHNPAPGSIMDHTITRRNYYDFFLVSQHVSCGTATPSHYIVLYDNSGLKPDYMQRLTYKFCHMYYNWPGTIRVPAPCQYAHKLAYLVGQNVKKDVVEQLRDKLFYL